MPDWIGTAAGDPCCTCPQPDLIRDRLRAKAKDPEATQEQRDEAKRMLEMFYPATALPDPNQGQCLFHGTAGI